jgi:DNA (cytosine-5)-methyltransferase 1
MNGRVLKRDPRNTLVYEFLRFVRGLRPRAVMLENVPGLQKRSMFRVLVSELRRLRYNVKYEILNASDYGVPQHRRRLVLIGSRVGEVSFAQKSSAKKTVRWAFRDLHNFIHGDELHRLPQERTARVAEIIKSVPQDGGSRRSLHGRLRLACHDRFDGFHDVYGRMSWDRPSPTITGGCCNPSKGRFLHPVKNRCISLREAAVLQSFPPTYYFSTARGKFATAQMIGNALPPEFIRRHAHALIEILRTNDDRREQ